MRVLPIVFNTEMVRAILEGRKSCTRRVVKPQPINKKYVLGFCTHGNKDDISKFIFARYEHGGNIEFCKPPYQPGDILYVRETYVCWRLPSGEMQYCYKATDPNGNMRPTSVEYDCEMEKRPWHPPIHMPKEAARIWIKVTDVRVERLKDMANDDALKEGAEGARCNHAKLGVYGCTDCMNTGWLEPPLVEFMQIWDSTVKKSDLDLYGWNANPWVWVIEFERCEKPKE